jgi:CCR4-NOT complex subunit CAF16
MARMQERGATIIYATHIFDGMEKWATHMAFVTDGHLKRGGPTTSIPEMNTGKRLLDVMTNWLREEQVERKKVGYTEQGAGGAPDAKRFSPFMPSKHMAFFR